MAKKNEKRSVSLFLIDIQETEFKFNSEFEYSQVSDDTLEFGMGQKFNADVEAERLSVEVSFHYIYLPTDVDLARLTIVLNFQIKNLGEFIKPIEDGIQTDDSGFVLNILNVAIGTLRGVCYARLKGTPLEKHPIPLISNEQLAKMNNM